MRARRTLLRRTLLIAAAAALATGTTTVGAAPASAQTVALAGVVSADPAGSTPNVLDGAVKAIVQIGDTVVLGGSFSQVQAASGGPVLERHNLVAFSARTGAVSTAFAAGTDDEVSALVPAADGTSVYVGGFFSTVNGVKSRRLAQLNLGTGALVPTFKAPAMDGKVKDLRLTGGRLWVAGSFATIAGHAQPVLATLDATTGAYDPYMSLAFSQPLRGGALQVAKMDVTPDGSRLVAVGNFGAVAGASRPQLALLDLTGASARVANWATQQYAPDCSSSFDTYLRDVDFAPDGSFFVISTTGAYKGSTSPCDTTMRWETAATGTAVAPTWVDYTGGDTTYAVAVTAAAVYVGGHFRWENNAFAGDVAAGGAVAREGLAALDPANGLPLSWNPGRERGVGVFDILATPNGIWVGSDTDRIGPSEYHARIAFFPLAGGTALAPSATGTLPGHVFLAGSTAAVPPAPTADPVLYRVNAGGPKLASGDTGPAWAADNSLFGGAYHNVGSLISSYSTIGKVDRTVPAGTPAVLFSTERNDPSLLPEMHWAFPVAKGTKVQVRLYFASRSSTTGTVGSRVFTVGVDGKTALSAFDIVAAAGQNVGTMRSVEVTSDGTVDIDFTHVKNNPVLSGIEIVRADAPAPTAPAAADGVRDVYYDGVKAAPATPVAGTGIAWGTSRGSVMIDGNVYTGYADGSFTRRGFDGTTFGPAAAVDGSDLLVRLDAWHTEVARLTGMFFDRGRLYYTLSGDSSLYYRGFTPESGVVSAVRTTASPSVAGVDLGKVAGMFLAGGKLYVASADGTLRRADWSNGAPVAGTAVVVGGPSVDGIDWRSRGMFVYTGHNLAGGVNQPPTAALDVACTDLACTVHGTRSADSDGTVAGYAWDFGDGRTATGMDARHTYAAAGDYRITLTVTDDDGASTSAGRLVTVTAPPPARTPTVDHVGSSAVNANATSFRVTVPAGVAPGDTLLLFATTATDVTSTVPAGWEVAATVPMGTGNGGSTVWRRQATATDAGKGVTVTLSATAKAAVTLTAYTGTPTTGAAPVAAGAAETVSRAQHTAPAVTVAAAGSAVLHYWADRSTATTSWTAPQGQTDRGQTTGTGAGHISSLLTDGGSAVPAGQVPGATATADTASAKAVMISVVLAPRG